MKRMIAFLLVVVLLITLGACSVQNQKLHIVNQNEDAAFSGVVLMTKDGKTVYEESAGFEKNNSQEPITVDTLFCMGSVSKQFAAGAILILQQDGELSVDDPLTKYYPQYTIGKDLTIRHLLDMRSGIKEFYDIEYIDDAFTELPTGELRGKVTNRNTVEENRQILEDWILRQPLEFEPDTSFEYCNSNYFLLARIVEKVSGMSYSDYVRERIFDPLGMTNSMFIDEVDFRNVPHLAAPTVHPHTVFVGITMGLGDMISNAKDIDRWLTSLKTNQILTKESVEMMSTDYTSDVDDEDYGFGIRMFGNGLFHAGAITTYETMVYTDTETGVNVFAVTNNEPNVDVSTSDMVWGLVDSLESEDSEEAADL